MKTLLLRFACVVCTLCWPGFLYALVVLKLDDAPWPLGLVPGLLFFTAHVVGALVVWYLALRMGRDPLPWAAGAFFVPQIVPLVLAFSPGDYGFAGTDPYCATAAEQSGPGGLFETASLPPSFQWRCPKCGTVLQKTSLHLGQMAARGVAISGSVTCGSCKAEFSARDVYGGAYDV